MVLLRSMLIMLPLAAEFKPPRRVAIAHRNLSWEPQDQFRPVKMGNLPGLPALSALPVIGSAFLSPKGRKELLIVIRPSVVSEPDG